MRIAMRPWLTISLTALTSLPALAQQPPPPAAPPQTAPVRPAGVAATVNGQPIPEAAVQRGLRRVSAAKQAEARQEIIDFLAENVLVDQYLLQLNVAVEQKDVDGRLEQIKGEIKKQGQNVEKVMQELLLTEEELKAQVTADLRWDKFAAGQANDKALQDFFEANKEIFDGTMLRARHILLAPAAADKTGEQTKAQLTFLKKQIEDQVNAGLAKLPAQTDNLEREKNRVKLLDDAFAAAAEKSACPSKEQGGDVGWFPRAGGMVESFAKAAFALKPYQLSDVVQTPYGYHLILPTDRKAGKETKFEEVKEDVKEVYGEKVREALVGRLKPAAKIVVNPPPK